MGIRLRKGQSGKVAVTVSAAIALIILYGIIFVFSAQDAETSGNVSYRVSRKCVELLDHAAARHWSTELKDGLAAFFEHPFRKLAHFGEYTCMAGILYVLWRQWMERDRRLFVLVVIWVFCSAALDELHQIFSPGRYNSFGDVLLDTCGGIFGYFVCVLVERGYGRLRRFSRARK